MSDPLSTLLRVAGVRGSLMSRACLAVPFGVSTRGGESALFHIPRRGEIWIRCEGEDVRAGVGDVVVLPRGSPHAITHARGGDATWIGSFQMECGQGLPTLVDGRATPDLDLVCGSFQFGEPARSWVIESLPPVFAVRATGPTARFLEGTLELIETELAEGEMGSSLVSDRLVEVLVVQLLRHWIATRSSARPGWLAGMTDPRLGPVIRAVHEHPDASWTLDRMARLAGLSRTRFSERFRDTVGVAPGNWITEWRIAVARRALGDGAGVAGAAESAGYASEASFSRAFKRVMGVSPGAWRRQRPSP